MHHGSLNDFINYLQRRNPIMELSLFDKLRPFISKIIAVPVGGGLAYLATRTGIEDWNDPNLAVTVATTLTWFILEVVHTVVGKKTNPLNANSAPLAAAGKEEAKLVDAKGVT